MDENKNIRLQGIILGSIAAAGILATALVAPNALRILDNLGVIKTKRRKERIKRSLDSLVRKGLVERSRDGYVRLTFKGERRFRELELKSFELKKPRKWDLKWRMLIFDIPEKLRRTRTELRLILSDKGFIRLQDSVWIYPHDCEEFVQLLKTDLGVRKHVLFIVADSIEDDFQIRKHFKLR